MVMRRGSRGGFFFLIFNCLLFCSVLIHSLKLCNFAAHGDFGVVVFSQMSMSFYFALLKYLWICFFVVAVTHIAGANLIKNSFHTNNLNRNTQ